MSKSWPTSTGRRWITRRRHTFPFDTSSAPTDCSTRFSPHFSPSSPCPKVSSALISEASIPSASDGRVPSTKRKRTSEMDVDSETPEPRKASSPKKRKFKTNRSILEDDDWVPATINGPMYRSHKSSENSGPVSEKIGNFPKASSDDCTRTIWGFPIYRPYTPPCTSENVASTENVQKITDSFTKLEFENDYQNYEVRPEVVQEFFAKYRIFKMLQQGGFGTVYTGERLEDKLPVAIKVISKEKVPFLIEVVNEVPITKTPMEVVMLSRIGAGLGSEGSTITPVLLDWYDAGAEVVLVFERPEPCMDLLDYVLFYHRQGMNCEIAKVIFCQLVELAIEMQERGIFHRDIKPENILIEDNDVIPKARFIDFGSATTFLPGKIFIEPQGTVEYSSPEWFRDGQFRASSTTVWQMGLVLYFMLFKRIPLKQEETIGSFREVPIPRACSEDLRSLLRGCLMKDPTERFTLQDVINHPWLNS